jgi:anti-sigma B factor antagonist
MTSALIMTRSGIEAFPEPLKTRQVRHGDTVLVVASGEIDVSSADRLRAELLGLFDSCRQLVLDLRAVVFIESSGLHCILDVDKESRAASVEFALVPGPPQVQRLFELTKTADMLHFIEPVEPPGA